MQNCVGSVHNRAFRDLTPAKCFERSRRFFTSVCHPQIIQWVHIIGQTKCSKKAAQIRKNPHKVGSKKGVFQVDVLWRAVAIKVWVSPMVWKMWLALLAGKMSSFFRAKNDIIPLFYNVKVSKLWVLDENEKLPLDRFIGQEFVAVILC